MSELKVVSFGIGDEEYAIDIMKVDSIIRVERITWIPEIPSFVEGVMDFRGTVIPVISGRKRFLGAVSEPDGEEKNRAIIISREDRKVGIFVDEVKEVMTIDRDSLKEPPREIFNGENECVSAISIVKNRMVLILDVEKTLDGKEFFSFANSGV